ncbi:MAG: oligosaccharide flippase family protein, partial [Chloroflexi bacterium]|nr:oligosaccharide flippase family protein [Chloroflexota bacterium]
MSIVRRNIFALLSAQVATWGISIVMIVFVPHVVTPVNYGRWGFAGVIASFVALFAGFGTPQYVTKEVARDDAMLEPLVAHALALRVPLTVFLGALAFGALSLLGYPWEIRWLLVICCFAVLITGASAIFAAALQGEQRMQRTAFWFTIERYIDAGGMIAALQAGFGLIAAVTVSTCSYMISLLATWSQLASRQWRRVRWQRETFRRLLAGGSPFFLWSFALTVYGSIDIMLLTLMAGDAAVGRYLLAYKFVSIPGAVPVLLSTALFPVLVSASVTDGGAFAHVAQRAF